MIVEGKKDEKPAGGNPMGGMPDMYWYCSYSIKKVIISFLIMLPKLNKLHSLLINVQSIFINPLFNK